MGWCVGGLVWDGDTGMMRVFEVRIVWLSWWLAERYMCWWCPGGFFSSLSRVMFAAMWRSRLRSDGRKTWSLRDLAFLRSQSLCVVVSSLGFEVM